MQIILLKDVKGQGRKDSIIDVKDGYGNFLIKNKSAVMVTTTGVKRLESEKRQRKEQEDTLIKTCKELKLKLENEKLTFKVKTGKEDRVFGSISSKQISELLKQKGYDIDKKKIIAKDITSLGFHNVEINLHKTVVANIKIEVVK